MMITEVSGSTGDEEQIGQENESRKKDKMTTTQAVAKDIGIGKHRMTRKKRRRLEAENDLRNEKEAEVILIWCSCLVKS